VPMGEGGSDPSLLDLNMEHRDGEERGGMIRIRLSPPQSPPSSPPPSPALPTEPSALPEPPTREKGGIGASSPHRTGPGAGGGARHCGHAGDLADGRDAPAGAFLGGGGDH